MVPVANLRDEWNQLHTVVTIGSIKDALAVLAAGCVDIDQGGGPQGLTPLMIAVFKARAHVVEALLKSGANSSIAAEGGFTALHLGAQERNATVVKMLTNAGVDLEVVAGSNGLTPLHAAESGGDSEAACGEALTRMYYNSGGHEIAVFFTLSLPREGLWP
ncbi:unnamed protein product [Ectocarpus sp. CCAP 1310/34]|nr:unnamed protein product [Ectocarpus sp. CCAP 1310/34]